jgi:uncharacterized cupredoxin-like copper-binding protein
MDATRATAACEGPVSACRNDRGEEERMSGTLRRGFALIAIVGLLVGCSAPAASADPNAPIAVTLKEWQITPSSTTHGAGKITFNIINNGDKEHEFVVRKTDSKAEALPLNADGEVSEDAPELTAVGDPSEVADIKSGSSNSTLTVTLQPGHYVFFCNLHVEELLHYQKGMRVDFTVS